MTYTCGVNSGLKIRSFYSRPYVFFCLVHSILRRAEEGRGGAEFPDTSPPCRSLFSRHRQIALNLLDQRHVLGSTGEGSCAVLLPCADIEWL